MHEKLRTEYVRLHPNFFPLTREKIPYKVKYLQVSVSRNTSEPVALIDWTQRLSICRSNVIWVLTHPRLVFHEFLIVVPCQYLSERRQVYPRQVLGHYNSTHCYIVKSKRLWRVAGCDKDPRPIVTARKS